jgi:hypothetical protein
MKLLWLPVLLLPLATAVLAQKKALPAFEQFGVDETFTGKPAAPKITGVHRSYRTMIRQGAAKGPNFAGHYTIADWGCGTSCVSMAIIDAKDGSVHDGPFGYLGWGLPLKYEGRYSAMSNSFEPLSYRIDSRLLIVRGCPQDENCASYFYEWADSRFKLIRKIPAVEAKP